MGERTFIKMIDSLVLAQICERCYHSVTKQFPNGTEVLVEGDVIAFRGTEFDGRDILRDLRALPWHDPVLGWCHAGFLKGVRGECWEWLEGQITEKTLLIGHSLGGAEADIAGGLAVSLLGIRPQAIVTFGAPRAGFAQLGRVLKDVPHLRHVHGSDCVPSHPWPLWGYRHLQGLWDLNSVDDGDRFGDHKIGNYIRALSI
jgi:hypothetical protein